LFFGFCFLFGCCFGFCLPWFGALSMLPKRTFYVVKRDLTDSSSYVVWFWVVFVLVLWCGSILFVVCFHVGMVIQR